MAKPADDILHRYLDGELSAQQAARVEKELRDSPGDRADVEAFGRIGTLMRLMDEEMTTDVSFEGLSDKVLAEIKTTRSSLSLWENIKTWLSEFFSYRRAVWVPAAAVVGAACSAVLIVPLFGAPPAAVSGASDTGIVLHSAAPATGTGSRIEAVDFGGATGTQYAMDDGSGHTVGVVWITEGQ